MKINYLNGNIADMSVDAIVLPANGHLKEGSGSSRAIIEKAGREQLRKICEKAVEEHGVWNTSDIVTTEAFHLDAKCLLHVVVPRWIDGNSEEYVDLMTTYIHALREADIRGCKSIAFPLLASGNNGFNLEVAFQIAQEAIGNYEPINTLRTVFLVLYGNRIQALAKKAGVDVKPVRSYYRIKSRIQNRFFKHSRNIIVTGVYWVSEIKKFLQENPEVRQYVRRFIDSILGKIGSKLR